MLEELNDVHLGESAGSRDSDTSISRNLTLADRSAQNSDPLEMRKNITSYYSRNVQSAGNPGKQKAKRSRGLQWQTRNPKATLSSCVIRLPECPFHHKDDPARLLSPSDTIERTKIDKQWIYMHASNPECISNVRDCGPNLFSAPEWSPSQDFVEKLRKASIDGIWEQGSLYFLYPAPTDVTSIPSCSSCGRVFEDISPHVPRASTPGSHAARTAYSLVKFHILELSDVDPGSEPPDVHKNPQFCDTDHCTQTAFDFFIPNERDRPRIPASYRVLEHGFTVDKRGHSGCN